MKRMKVTASSSDFIEYKTDMMTEEEVKELYERYSRLFAKTDNDKYLYMAGVVKDILRVSNQDDQKVFEYYLDMKSAGEL